jgi:tetratricopeptide (TPR) repeat protein
VISDTSQVLTQAPGNAQAYSLRGYTRLRKGEPDLALADFSEAIRLAPKDRYSYCQRAQIYHGKEQYELELKDYDEVIRRDPENPANCDTYQKRAWLRVTVPDPKLRDPAVALESASKACEITGWKNVESLVTLAAVQSNVDDFDAAIKTLDKAIGLLDEGDPRMRACREMQESYRQRKPYQ